MLPFGGYPFSMADPGASTYATGASSTAECTLESIYEAARKLSAFSKEYDRWDVIVMTSAVYERVRKYIAKRADTFHGADMLTPDRLYGIPLEVYPLEADVNKRATELLKERKRVISVTE